MRKRDYEKYFNRKISEEEFSNDREKLHSEFQKGNKNYGKRYDDEENENDDEEYESAENYLSKLDKNDYEILEENEDEIKIRINGKINMKNRSNDIDNQNE